MFQNKNGQPTATQTGPYQLPRLQDEMFKLLSEIVYIQSRVTSLEQLSLAEFSGEKAKPKVYEDSHINVLGMYLIRFGIEGQIQHNSGYQSHRQGTHSKVHVFEE